MFRLSSAINFIAMCCKEEVVVQIRARRLTSTINVTFVISVFVCFINYFTVRAHRE